MLCDAPPKTKDFRPKPKMSRLLFLYYLILGLAPICLLGQASEIRTDYLRGTFKLEEGKESQLLRGSLVRKDTTYIALFQLEQLAVQDQADLSLLYQLIDLEPGVYYEPIDISIKQLGQEIALPVERLRGDLTRIEAPSKNSYHFIWQDALEQALYYGEEYDLSITCKLYGEDINCDTPAPTFSLGLKDRRLFYTGLVGGGVLLWTGRQQYNKATTAYDSYVDLWKIGEEEGVAARLLEDAVTDNTNRNRLVAAGTGLIVASVGGLLYQYFRKHLPKVKRYNKYCQKSNQVVAQPKIGYQFSPTGLGIAFHF